jgi:hypothetical protein
MKFDLISQSEGMITVAADPMFSDLKLAMSTKKIKSIAPSSNNGNP